ncbi:MULTISPECIES: hypothetical protein [Streptomyces]|uniref:hypothetical protein n=1 Tax=Streptomyces TaxID=1883 RepID=UPI00081F44E9|nr:MULTISPECIES: hypothetical protein [Streptomyces]MCX5340125.1 hypothetical protein [Streptomyces atratus]MEE1810822.1 hypothetical protein [Streptomyces sp. BE133]WPW31955.1 hypothetical protein P6B95_34235 [Streptomyces atratus]SCF89074.1 hypothetical protein GA0115254_1216161 [Streptomyces sp. Ncost-T10-10d]GGT18676.1 hypothetical protein GCM10010207_17140 [Streptomyces atratus]
MTYRQGQRVEYRDQQNQKQQGEIRQTEGSGAQTRYAVQNEKTMREEKINESQIERELS